MLGIRILGVADRAFGLGNGIGDPVIAFGADTAAPFDRDVGADLRPPVRADLAEIMGEHVGGRGSIGPMHRHDRLRGQPHIGVQPLDRRIVPRLDLAEEDLGQDGAVEGNVARLHALDVDDRNRAAHHGRELQQAVAFQVGALERQVGRGERHRPRQDLPDARARADRLIVQPDAGLLLVGLGPERVDRIRKHRPGASDDRGRPHHRIRRRQRRNRRQWRLRRGRWRHRDAWRVRDEVEPAGERRVLPRHLPALGFSHHVVANGDQDRTQIVVRRAQVSDKRARKRGVSRGPIERHVAGLGGEADEGADPGLSRCQAAPDIRRACTHGPREVRRERVVAAGVEEQDVGGRLALHCPLHEIKPHHLEIERRRGPQLRINRDQVVGARYLQTVPGIEEHADVRADERSGEIADSFARAPPCRDRCRRGPQSRASAGRRPCHPHRCACWRAPPRAGTPRCRSPARRACRHGPLSRCIDTRGQ